MGAFQKFEHNIFDYELFNTGNVGTEGSEADINLLISSIYLLYVVDAALALSREGGNEQCHTSTNIG